MVTKKCAGQIQAAAAALGRTKLSDAQLAALEEKVSAARHSIARADPQRWHGLTEAERMQEAASAAMQAIAEQAQRKLENAERQIVAVARTDERIQALQDSYAGTKGHDGSRAEALKRDFALSDVVIKAEKKITLGRMFAMVEAAGNKMGETVGRKVLMAAFQAENRVMTNDIVREIFKGADGHSGNKVATIAAKSWLDTIEGLRTRFNAAGGDVGKLDYGYVPQPWDTAKIRKGQDAFAQFLLDKVDRDRYLRDDGSRMNDDELFDVLNRAVVTLATEGANKAEPGVFKGAGARANRGQDARQIHFKDGNAWAQVMAEYGKGSLYDAMVGHVSAMTRDTVLIERYGPNPAANARLQFETTSLADGTKERSLVKWHSVNPQTYWDILNGKVGMPVDEGLAKTGAMVRNLGTAAKLGGAVISSVTDLGTMAVTAGFNRLSYWSLLKDVASQGSKETRDWMATHGMIAESAADNINRWSGDNIGQDVSGKISNTTMRLSLLNAWTDSMRQGFTMTMNAGLAKMAKQQWSALSEFDRAKLTRAGLSEADWQVLNGVAPSIFKGRELLTPQSIAASGHERAGDIAGKIFGLVHDESEFAVVNPDIRTRAITTWGGKEAGTFSGELARCTMQFKSFPIAMMTRHWARMLEGDMGAGGAPLLANRVLYSTAIMATLTGLGAVATQSKQVLQGKDPIDMTGKNAGRFWAKALAQGGGFGIAGDLFLVDPSGSAVDASTNLAKNLAGPAIGSASELVLKVISENVWQAAEGKDTHWEAELAQWAKSNTPGASLWWAKPLMEHGFLNSMMENLSPGYLSKIQSRAKKDWGNDMWWRPGAMVPDRAPDLAKAVGE